MGRKRRTITEEEYYKQRKRIQAFLRNAKKRGYIFPDNILPTIPQKITEASVRRLERYTPKYLYGKSVGFYRVGKILTAGQGRYIERKKAAKKASVTIRVKKQKAGKAKEVRDKYYEREKTHTSDSTGSPAVFSYNVLQEVREKIANWTPLAHWSYFFIEVKKHDKQSLEDILVAAIEQYGEETVASRLEQQALLVTHLTDEILYGSGTNLSVKDGRTVINEDLSAMAVILKGSPLTPDEARYWGDMQDFIEVVN